MAKRSSRPHLAPDKSREGKIHMVDYRGVEKQDIINSLQQAEAFLRRLDMGPATVKVLDDWLAKDPYAKIEAATTREALATAMKQMQSTSVFLRAGDIFVHHALVDTDGVGRKIFEGLGAWGGLSGTITADYRPTDEEQDAHLVIEYTKLIAALEMKGKLPEKVLAKYKEDFLQMHGSERHEFKESLYEATGLFEKFRALKPIGPFDLYGIPIEAMSDPINNPMSPDDTKALTISLLPLCEQIRTILAPFLKTDEAETYGGDHAIVIIGQITEDWKNMGVAFIATKSAAQAVADRLPEYKLINREGIQVVPSPKTAAPKPVKRPRPPGP
jgi:hypothetical protein